MLHFPVQVNGRTIGHVRIQRLETMLDPYRSHQYTVRARLNGVVSHGHCWHRYADGALVLIAKALASLEATEQAPSSDTGTGPVGGSGLALAVVPTPP